jgi:hypothetical protein
MCLGQDYGSKSIEVQIVIARCTQPAAVIVVLGMVSQVATATQTCDTLTPLPACLPACSQDKREKERFFNWFYLAINVGRWGAGSAAAGCGNCKQLHVATAVAAVCLYQLKLHSRIVLHSAITTLTAGSLPPSCTLPLHSVAA